MSSVSSATLQNSDVQMNASICTRAVLLPAPALSPLPLAQAEINTLRARVGRQRAPLLGRQALAQEALEGQRIEIARLQEEAQQRALTLEGLLAGLSAQCAELGEDLGALAAEAHPSLTSVRRVDSHQSFSGQQSRNSRCTAEKRLM